MIRQDVIWKTLNDYKMLLLYLSCFQSQVGERSLFISTLEGFILTTLIYKSPTVYLIPPEDTALTGEQTGHETDWTKLQGATHTGLCGPTCGCWLERALHRVREEAATGSSANGG